MVNGDRSLKETPTALLPSIEIKRGASAQTCYVHESPNHIWAYDFVFDSCADGQPSNPPLRACSFPDTPISIPCSDSGLRVF